MSKYPNHTHFGSTLSSSPVREGDGLAALANLGTLLPALASRPPHQRDPPLSGRRRPSSTEGTTALPARGSHCTDIQRAPLYHTQGETTHTGIETIYHRCYASGWRLCSAPITDHPPDCLHQSQVNRLYPIVTQLPLEAACQPSLCSWASTSNL